MKLYCNKCMIHKKINKYNELLKESNGTYDYYYKKRIEELTEEL